MVYERKRRGKKRKRRGKKRKKRWKEMNLERERRGKEMV